MQTNIHAFFPGRLTAVNASEALRKAGFNASYGLVEESGPRQLRVMLESTEDDRRMMLWGLMGSAIGCLSGLATVSHVQGREMMYLVIVPLAFTFWGLALGLFGAMGVVWIRHINRDVRTETETVLSAVGDNAAYVSVHADSAEAAERVQTVVAEFEPINISMEVVSAESVALTLAPSESSTQTPLRLSA